MNFKNFFGPTLDERLIHIGGHPSGFDYMRLLLALGIIFFHSFEVSYGPMSESEAYQSFWRAPVAMILPMFFALSGFLVSGSLDRAKNLGAFAGLRILRILPALFVEVTLAALVLGPLLTTLPLSEYYSDPKFFAYFKNITGNVQYMLPGVFSENPARGTVNAQLWTLPYELQCYFVLTALALMRIYKKRSFLLLAALGYFALCSYFLIFGDPVFKFHARPMTVAGNTLLLSFIAGVVIYKFRDLVPWNPALFIICAILSFWALSNPDYDMFAAVPVTYATIYLGLLNPRENKIVLSGDYSYGLFLYGYPIQQAVASLGPWTHEWHINFLIACPATLMLAIASWWLVEKPTLSLRRYLYKPDY